MTKLSPFCVEGCKFKVVQLETHNSHLALSLYLRAACSSLFSPLKQRRCCTTTAFNPIVRLQLGTLQCCRLGMLPMRQRQAAVVASMELDQHHHHYSTRAVIHLLQQQHQQEDTAGATRNRHHHTRAPSMCRRGNAAQVAPSAAGAAQEAPMLHNPLPAMFKPHLLMLPR